MDGNKILNRTVLRVAITICFAIVFRGRASGQDFGRFFSRVNFKICFGPADKPILWLSRLNIRPTSRPETRYPARKHYCIT